MSKHILITGASGFVAAHVLRKVLNDTDWQVTCLIEGSHAGIPDRQAFSTKDMQNLESRLRFIYCDLSEPIDSKTTDDIGYVDYVINLASESHVDRSIQSPSEFIIKNVKIICHLLDWARVAKPEKILHASTDEVYGPLQSDLNIEGDPHIPSNPYSASKAAQEDIIQAYWRTYRIPVGIMNFTNMFGEGQDLEKFTPLAISKITTTNQLAIHTYAGGLVGTRYWLYAGNAASGMVYALSQPFPVYDETNQLAKWNLGSSDELSNLEWAEEISKYLGASPEYVMVDSNTVRPGYDHRYGLDTSKMYSIGWTPEYDNLKALKSTVNWYLEHPNWLK